MDGMGETYRTMMRGEQTNDPTYVSDFSFGEDSFQCIPSDLSEQSRISYFDFREAESVYTYTKGESTLDLKPIFKRFTPERSPPTLYNVSTNMLHGGFNKFHSLAHFFDTKLLLVLRSMVLKIWTV
eukprot:scaffold22592_cov129-Cylindrotheca_fusiformis.AAC.12